MSVQLCFNKHFCNYHSSFKYVVLLSFILFSLNSYAQREADNWYFGDSVGLNFSSGYPIPLNNSVMDGAGAATWSDSLAGELLFYSNSHQVWNRKHELMPNGDSLRGEIWIKQNSLIIPVPSRQKKYYLFTLGASSAPKPDSVVATAPPFYSDLLYSIVDMELDSGLGDIVDSTKNTLLADSLTQKMAIVPHENGRDYWLIAHNIGDNCFQVFLIQKDGISEPQQQCIGTNHSPVSEGELFYQSRGQIKASPNNKMLAVTSWSFLPRPFDLFRFDNDTGLISDHITLAKMGWQEGLSFSPDNSKLYITGIYESDSSLGNTRSFLYQYNLRAYKEETINNSRIRIEVPDNTFIASPWLELAPDGRIYGSTNWGRSEEDEYDLLVIQHPNKRGAAAGLTGLHLDFEKGRPSHSLPNFVQNVFNGLEAEEFPVIPEGADPCMLENVVHLFPNPTNKFIQLKIFEGCYQPYALTIYNVLGQRISRFSIEKPTSDFIEMQNYASGLYFAEIKMPNRKKVVKKFIVR